MTSTQTTAVNDTSTTPESTGSSNGDNIAVLATFAIIGSVLLIAALLFIGYRWRKFKRATSDVAVRNQRQSRGSRSGRNSRSSRNKSSSTPSGSAWSSWASFASMTSQDSMGSVYSLDGMGSITSMGSIGSVGSNTSAAARRFSEIGSNESLGIVR